MALTQVKSDGIATGAVTADQIAANAVTVDDIADGSISTAKLADANVTTAKIADDAVTADKLANTAVTAGSYTLASVTVDAQGRITAASSGTAGDSDRIFEGNTSAEVVDTGSDGHFKVVTEGTEALRVTAAQRVGIGVTDPAEELEVSGSGGSRIALNRSGNDGYAYIGTGTTNDLHFGYDGSGSLEYGRFDSSGRLLINGTTSQTWSGGAPLVQVSGTSASGTMHLGAFQYSNSSDGGELVLGSSRGTTVGANTIVQENDTLGRIRFCGADGVDFTNRGGEITCAVDGAPGSNDLPTRMMFYTASDGAGGPTERMRIDRSGRVMIGTTSVVHSGAFLNIRVNDVNSQGTAYGTTSTSGRVMVSFNNPNGEVGYIVTSGTTTGYNTSSDYRLKENVVDLDGAITRIKQLQPSRFNFIADPNKTVDGFIAHEVQDVVPEAIFGEKDAVDDEGNPKYQGIDQSKLVPLLTAALQEAIGKIEALETANASQAATIAALDARLIALEA